MHDKIFEKKSQIFAILEKTKIESINLKYLSEFNYIKNILVNFHKIFLNNNRLLKNFSLKEKIFIGKYFKKIKIFIKILFKSLFINLLKKKYIYSSRKISKKEKMIDPSFSLNKTLIGNYHPLTKSILIIEDFFDKWGFSKKFSSEIETEWFCFDALNTPLDHPARQESDTFFLEQKTLVGNVLKKNKECLILRTHTSSCQIHSLLQNKLPLRIITSGRVYRKDTIDSTHMPNFHQLEGIYVDKKVTLLEMLSLLKNFLYYLFGSSILIRLRPSFFPFTNPSFEIDIKSNNFGKLSNSWVEILGCGMVHKKVLQNLDIDSLIWNGFAFGMGIERITMLLNKVDDIRLFYKNDLRFLNQF